MSFKNLVCFDESHNEGGRINTTYASLRELLEKNNFECVTLNEFPITYDKLKKYDILVIAGPDMSKFRISEIDDILKYVDAGGNLVLMSDAGGDSGHMTNLNKIAQPLGFQFNADQVTDQKLNLGVETVPVLEQATPHDITRGVGSISYRAGCSITVTGDAQVIFKSNQTSSPPNAPIIVLSGYGKGKSIGIGTYEIFRDRLLGGLNSKYHSTLALNIFQYLVSFQPSAEEAEIIVEEIREETSPLLKELAEIKNDKSTQLDVDVKQDRIIEAKITPLRESYSSREQEEILKSISQEMTTLSAAIKEQLYVFSDLHEKISEANRHIEKIASTFKNIKINDLYDNITNLNKDFKKIDGDINKLLDNNNVMKTQLEAFKLIQDDYKKSFQSLIDNVKSTINTAVIKISKDIEERLKPLNSLTAGLKNIVQETVENIIQKRLPEFSESQEQRIKILETRINEKLNSLLIEFSKKPSVEESKPQIYKEPEKLPIKSSVKRKTRRKNQA